MKILIIEDEPDLVYSAVAFLQHEGLVCEYAMNRFEGEDKLLAYHYDVVVLDISFPDGNGFHLLELIKKNFPETGVLIMSAKNSPEDRTKGLNIGADDYIPKPVHLPELNARVKALIRRRKFRGRSEVLFHEIYIDTESQTIRVHGNNMDVTKKEYDLMLFFMSNPERVLTRESIAEHLWGDDIDMASNYDFLYTHIKNLRKKILKLGGNDYLTTVYGIGYKFSAL